METNSRAREIRNYVLYFVFSIASIAAVIEAGDLLIHFMHGTL
jgi:hypothetical protein